MLTENRQELKQEIIDIAKEYKISPKEVAKKLAPKFTEDEVFDMIDRLSNIGMVYFDVEDDVLRYTGYQSNHLSGRWY